MYSNPNLSKDVVRVNTPGSHFLIQKERSAFEEVNSVFLVYRRSGRAILLPFYRPGPYSLFCASGKPASATHPKSVPENGHAPLGCVVFMRAFDADII